MKSYAPVLLFAFNRPNLTKKTLSALQANYLAPLTDVEIFVDGPRHVADENSVKEVFDIANRAEGFRSVAVHASASNRGLGASVIDGVSAVLTRRESVIVLEDDLLSTPNFLDFMNQALAFYKSHPRVMSVSGYTLGLPALRTLPRDYYVGYRASSWGWGTWSEEWQRVDWSVADYPEFRWDPIAQLRFSRGGIDMPRMLRNQMTGKIDSWAIRWCYYQWKNDLVTVFPTRSKVNPIGFGSNATHTTNSRRFKTLMDSGDKRSFRFHWNFSIERRVVRQFRRKFSLSARLLDRLFSPR